MHSRLTPTRLPSPHHPQTILALQLTNKPHTAESVAGLALPQQQREVLTGFRDYLQRHQTHHHPSPCTLRHSSAMGGKSVCVGGVQLNSVKLRGSPPSTEA